MTEHLDIDTLNAIAEGERVAEGGALVHLRSCESCAASIDSIKHAMASLASLPVVTPTIDEHRRLRQALIGRHPRIASQRRLVRWGLAGATALLVLGLGGYFLVQSLGPRSTGAGFADKATVQSAPSNFDFESESQVKNTVQSSSEVREGVKRYSVRDVSAAEADSVAGRASTTKQPSGALDYGDSSTSTAYPSGSDQLCLLNVRRSQPYPMIPLFARQATFKSKPSWLLVYLFSPTNDEEAKLDHVQYWLIAPKDCSTDPVSNALSYGSFVYSR